MTIIEVGERGYVRSSAELYHLLSAGLVRRVRLSGYWVYELTGLGRERYDLLVAREAKNK